MKPTPAKRQAELFCRFAQERKAWIPPDLALPDSITAIEAGRTPKPKQLGLLPDDSAMARLRAIKRNEIPTRKDSTR